MGRRNKQFRRGRIAHQVAQQQERQQAEQHQVTLREESPGSPEFMDALGWLSARQERQHSQLGLLSVAYQRPGNRHGLDVKAQLRHDRQVRQATPPPGRSSRGRMKQATRYQFLRLQQMYREETAAGTMLSPAAYRKAETQRRNAKEHRTRSSWPFARMTPAMQQQLTEEAYQRQQFERLGTSVEGLSIGFRKAGERLRNIAQPRRTE